jgi:hypothetical protein
VPFRGNVFYCEICIVRTYRVTATMRTRILSRRMPFEPRRPSLLRHTAYSIWQASISRDGCHPHHLRSSNPQQHCLALVSSLAWQDIATIGITIQIGVTRDHPIPAPPKRAPPHRAGRWVHQIGVSHTVKLCMYLNHRNGQHNHALYSLIFEAYSTSE